MLSLSTRWACRIRAYSSTRTILHLLAAGPWDGIPAYRRSLGVGPFWTRIPAGGGSVFDEDYQPRAKARVRGRGQLIIEPLSARRSPFLARSVAPARQSLGVPPPKRTPQVLKQVGKRGIRTCRPVKVHNSDQVFGE